MQRLHRGHVLVRQVWGDELATALYCIQCAACKTVYYAVESREHQNARRTKYHQFLQGEIKHCD